MTAATSYDVLMIGRILSGTGIGFRVMIAPGYSSEISPAFARGSLTSFPEIFGSLGILLGYVSKMHFLVFLLALTGGYFFLLWEFCPLCSSHLFYICIILESPRWLCKIEFKKLGDYKFVFTLGTAAFFLGERIMFTCMMEPEIKKQIFGAD